MLVEVPRVSLSAILATPFHARWRWRNDGSSHAAVEDEKRKEEWRTICATAKACSGRYTWPCMMLPRVLASAITFLRCVEVPWLVERA